MAVETGDIQSLAAEQAQRERPHPAYQRLIDAAPPTITFILLIAIWHFAVTLNNVSPVLFPSPGITLETIIESRSLLLYNTWPTLIESLVGLFVSIALGIPLGIVLAGRGWFSRSLFPLILGTQTIPKIALAPLLVVWLGFGMLPKYTLVFLVVFFPIVITTVQGIRSVPHEMLELSRICKMTRMMRLWRLELPFALPTILSGIKVAVTLALIAAIVSEFVAGNVGLGSLITNAQQSVKTDLIFAAVIVASVLGLVMFYVVELAERLMIPWHTSQRPKI